jgi:LPS export ABC transporter permease LptG/LPS export ABC transporter permease LptF
MTTMLRVLDRYVLKELAPPLGLGLVLLTFFLVVDRVYQLTDLVVTKGVPLPLILSLLVFMLPSFLTLTAPMAFLMATLVACGRLAGDLEIVALRASGVGPVRLLRPFLLAAGLVTAGTATLTLVVNPAANAAFQQQLFAILQARAIVGIKERTFNGTFPQSTIYVEEISPSQVALSGLLVSDERDPALSRIVTARHGRLLTDETQHRVTLRLIDGSIAEASHDDPRRFRHTLFSLYDMNLPLDSGLGSSSRLAKPERALSLGALLAEARAQRAEPEAAAAYEVELHKRFALPAASLVFLLVAFPLGIRAQRGGPAAALGISLGVVVAYYLLFGAFERLALRGQLPAWAALWVPTAMFGLGGLALLSLDRWRWPAAWSGRGWRLVGLARHLWHRGPGSPAEAARPPRPRRPRGSTFVIDRYVLRQYVGFLAAGLLVAAVLALVVDLFQTLDRVLRQKPPLAYILQHFLFRLPGMLYQGLPIIVLIATLFLFLSLSRQRELDALKAAGISLYRTSLPVLLLAVLISASAVLFQETVLPAINAEAEEVDRVRIQGQPPRHLQQQSRIWYRGADGHFYRIELLDPQDRSLNRLTVLALDRNFRTEDRLDARRAQWTGERWEVSDAVLRDLRGAGPPRPTVAKRMALSTPETLDDFVRLQKPADNMSFLELYDYVQKLRESGNRVGKYVVDMHARLSFPLVNAITALVAIPFALAAPKSGGRALGIAMAVMISVGYWLLHSMALAFAKADLLPPMLAAWTANIVFVGLGTALFLRART